MITNPMNTDLGIGATPLFPINAGVGTHDTGGIDMKTVFNRALFTLLVGVVGGGGTVDMKLQQCDDPSFGSGVSDIASFAITQITASTSIKTIEIRRAHVTKQYVRARVTIAVASCEVSVLIQGCNQDFGNANEYDDAAVTQRVSVAGPINVYKPTSLTVNDI